MAKIGRFYPLAGLLAILVYCLLALLAYLQYPGTFSPLQNWLSDLGDINQNPQGASLYNLGIILTGLLILFFFLNLTSWRLLGHKIQNIMVFLTQIFGILASLSMVLSAIFPINVLELHRIWSISLYVSFGTAFVFSVFALRYLPNYPKWALVLGILAACPDIASGIFHETTLLEWITVGFLLAYLLALSLLHLKSERVNPLEENKVI
jgi:hypothetical membrane protein